MTDLAGAQLRLPHKAAELPHRQTAGVSMRSSRFSVLSQFAMFVSVLLASTSSLGQPASDPSATPSRIRWDRAAVVRYSELVRRYPQYDTRVLSITGGDPDTCDAGTSGKRCDFTLKVHDVYLKGGTSPVGCLVEANDIKIEKGTRDEKTEITWTVPSAYEFEQKETGGILVTSGHKNLKAKSYTATIVKFEHAREKKPDTLTFLPVVLGKDSKGYKMLCAAVDPKIINQ